MFASQRRGACIEKTAAASLARNVSDVEAGHPGSDCLIQSRTVLRGVIVALQLGESCNIAHGKVQWLMMNSFEFSTAQKTSCRPSIGSR